MCWSIHDPIDYLVVGFKNNLKSIHKDNDFKINGKKKACIFTSPL